MISDRLRQSTRWLVEPAARGLHRAGITPNLLTLLGFLLNLVNAWLLAVGQLRLAGVLILAFTALDALDGTLARVSGQVTRFGAFLDSVLDRFAEAALFLGLLIYFLHADPKQELYAYLTYVAIIGSLLVSYTRARAEGLGLQCQAGWFTRVERIIALSLGLLAGWIRPVLWLLAILTNVTALQRMIHVYRLTRADTISTSKTADQA
jgi:CDP-diacylglycerol--glycerol-3-phosphate 3-phosphatidyltransferase